MKELYISCQICCKNLGILCNSSFSWLPQVDTNQIAILCFQCERMHGMPEKTKDPCEN